MATSIKGIVTRRIDFKENDEIISVFSHELGRVPILVRGAKRANSRYKALTQLFTYGDFGISQREGLSLLYQGETIEYFSRLKMDYQAMSHAAYLCELINQVGVDYHPDAELFEWLLACLTLMDEGYEPEGLTLAFELQILNRLGIALQLSGCATCQSQQIVGFSIAMGGFVCANHLVPNDSQLIQDPLVLKTLVALSRQEVSTLSKIKLPPDTKPILRQVFSQIFEQYSGLYLKSQKFLTSTLSF